MEKEAVKTPYTQLRESAKKNEKAKRSPAAVQIRLGLMSIGIIIAMAIYFFPNFISRLDGNKAIDQGKPSSF